MFKRSFSLILNFVLCISVIALPFQENHSASAATVLPQSTTPYLDLSVSPTTVRLGQVFTLSIAYHDIGLVYTTIQTNPPGLVNFDPPLSMPCKYDTHPNACTSITMRAIAKGVVTITASSTGEVYDSTCLCWKFGGATDNSPVSITVTDDPWPMFLPFTQR